MNKFEIIIEAVDKASEVFKTVGDAGSTAASAVADNWMAITGAGMAAGGAVMKLTDRSTDLNTTLKRVASTTDASESGMRKLIQSYTDATISNDDAVAAVERMAQAGITQEEQFEKLLPIFDTYADATGTHIVKGIDQFDRALSALGIPLEEAGEHMDALTFLSTQTSIDMNNLGMVMRREAGPMKEMGMSVEDITIAMAALESEGIRGPRSVMALQAAIQNSEGDMEKFWENLNVSSESLDTQAERLANSAGLTEELAAINNSTLTTWDHLKARMDDYVWSLGTALEPLRNLGPVMMAIGPAIKGVTMAKTGLTAATRGLSTAMAFLAANPVMLIILGLVALGAALVVAYQHSETFRNIVDGAFSRVQEVATAVFGAVSALVETVWPHIQAVIQAVIEWLSPFISGALEGLQAAWNTAWTAIQAVIDFVWPYIEQIVMTYLDLVKVYIETALTVLGALWDAAWAAIQFVIEHVWPIIAQVIETYINAAQQVIETVLGAIQAVWEKVWPIVQAVAETVWDAISSFIDTTINTIKTVIETALGIIETVWDTVWGTIQTIAETVWGLIEGHIDTTINTIQTIIETVMGTIESVWETVWGTVKTIAETLWDEIETLIDTSINAVQTVIETVLETIQTAWDTTWNKVLDIARTIWDGASGIYNTVKGSIESVKTFLGNIMGDIESAWSTAWGNVKSTVSGMWDEIAGAVRRGVNEVISAINTFIGHFNGITITVPSISIPSVDIPGVGTIGGGTLGGFSVGMPQVPTIPSLSRGGLTTGETLAHLHPGEVVLPLQSHGMRALSNALERAFSSLGVGNREMAASGSGDIVFDFSGATFYTRDRQEVERLSEELAGSLMGVLRGRGR